MCNSYYDETCPEAEKAYNAMHKAKEYFEGVLEALYSNGDLEMLDRCIEEMCCQLDVTYPNKDLMIDVRFSHNDKRVA